MYMHLLVFRPGTLGIIQASGKLLLDRKISWRQSGLYCFDIYMLVQCFRSVLVHCTAVSSAGDTCQH